MKIDEGYTFSYFFTALACFVLGALISALNLFIGLSMITIGVLLLFIKTGTVIDVKNSRIGRYSSLFGKHKIQWVQLTNFNKAHLDFDFISQKMNSRGTSSTTKTKSYKLILIGVTHKKLFHEYHNYDISKKILRSLQLDFKFEVIDKYYEIQKNAFNIRRKRGNRAQR